jgi:hypothetical protein
MTPCASRYAGCARAAICAGCGALGMFPR